MQYCLSIGATAVCFSSIKAGLMVIDIIVIVALLVSALIAFLRGFLREILTIIGVVGGYFAAYYGGGPFSGLIHTWMDINEADPAKLFDLIPYPMVADAVAYGSIFVFVVIVITVISYFSSDFISSLGLGPVDRTLGVVFGVARAVLLLGLLYLPFHLLLDDAAKESWFGKSKTFVYVEWTAKMLGNLLPEDFNSKEEAEQVTEGAREKLQNLDVLDAAQETLNVEKIKDQVLKKSDQEQDQEETDVNKGYSDEQRRGLDELFENGNGNKEE